MSIHETYEDDFMTLRHHEADAILELHWKEGTRSMTQQGFQLALAMFAAEAVAWRVRCLMVDTRLFRFSGPQSVEGWRQRTIVPLYNRSAITKFAYIFPESFELQAVTEPDATRHFATGRFHSPDAARAWFAA